MKDSTQPVRIMDGRGSVLARLRLAAPLILFFACAVGWLLSRWAAPGAGEIDLERQAARKPRRSEEQFRAYAPTSPVRLDDLAVDAEALLRGLPDVARVVRSSGPASKPALRIVQLCDVPVEPAESLRLQPNSIAYREYLARAEMLHHQQVAFLRCLARRHGVKAIHTLGLTNVTASVWQEDVGLLNRMLADEPDLLAQESGKQASEANTLLARLARSTPPGRGGRHVGGTRRGTSAPPGAKARRRTRPRGRHRLAFTCRRAAVRDRPGR